MKTVVLGWLMLVSVVALAEAGTITIAVQGANVIITTTAAQDAWLAKLRDRNNIVTGVTQTTNEFLRDVLQSTLQTRKQELDALEGRDFCTQWQTVFTTAQKNAVLALPGGFAPCP